MADALIIRDGHVVLTSATQEVTDLLRHLRPGGTLPEDDRERPEWLARKAAILERMAPG